MRDGLEVLVETILRWLVEGYLKYRDGGLKLPKAVTAATSDYRADMDDVGEFIQDRLIIDHKTDTSNDDLRSALISWCKDNNQRMHFRRLTNRLQLEGCFKWSTGKARGWSGVRIRESTERSPS